MTFNPTEREIEREARRVLPHVAREGRIISAAPGGGYGIFDSVSFRPRTNIRVAPTMIDGFLRQSYIARANLPEGDPRPMHFILAPAGLAFLERAAGMASGGGAQIVPLPGAILPASSAARQLGALRVRGGAEGGPLLGDEEIAAAERLHKEYRLAISNLERGNHWPRERVDGARRLDHTPIDVPEHVLRAKQSFWSAIDAMGAELAPCVVAIVCHQKSFEAAERELRMPMRSARILLRAGLMMLARHYGLAPQCAPRNAVQSKSYGPLPEA